MKRLLLIVLPLLLIFGCSKPISEETLIDKDGLKYHPDTKELFSGKVYSNHMGENKKIEGSYKDGKKDGLLIRWYKNGQKFREGTWKDGKSDGLSTLWYDNGQKWSERTYKDGKEDGLWTRWYDNGKKRFEGTYEDEERDGLWTLWYDNGQKQSEKTFKDGKRISIKEWNEDGSVKE
jgi:antitoxin component YwqK of YwqJK toxin-antitoxin module